MDLRHAAATRNQSERTQLSSSGRARKRAKQARRVGGEGGRAQAASIVPEVLPEAAAPRRRQEQGNLVGRTRRDCALAPPPPSILTDDFTCLILCRFLNLIDKQESGELISRGSLFASEERQTRSTGEEPGTVGGWCIEPKDEIPSPNSYSLHTC